MTIKEALFWAEKKLREKNISSAVLDAEVLLLRALSLSGSRHKMGRQSNLAKTKNCRSGSKIIDTSHSKLDKAWLLANQDGQLLAKEKESFKSLIKRRQKGEPLAYLTEKKEFFGLEFYVDKSVFIPRPETELLVEQAIKILKTKSRLKTILDLGTGSGCIIISLANYIYCPKETLHSLGRSENLKSLFSQNPPTLPTLVRVGQRIKLFASDISSQALKVARRNAKKHKTLSRIDFRKGDLFKPWHSSRKKLFSDVRTNISRASGPMKFDLIIANLPYLKKSELLPYEPEKALWGGKKGVEIYKRFLKETAKHLNKKGVILMEISPEQKKILSKEIKKYFFSGEIQIIKDLAGKNRVLKISL